MNKRPFLISRLLEENPGINITISGKDLREFGESLIAEFKNDGPQNKNVNPLTASEVEERFGICPATRWRWDKIGILKSQRVGNRIYYLESDIEELLQKKKGG